MSVRSDQHWADPIAGLREMARVARRVVVFQLDTSDPGRFWLTATTSPSSPSSTKACPRWPGGPLHSAPG
jgi:hypothetical protein